MSSPKIYTRTGDDGSTGLFYGGRVPKDSALPMAYGAVDEAQAFLGVARAQVSAVGSDGGAADADTADLAELDAVLSGVCKDLYVLMAELATDPQNHDKLEYGTSRVTAEMAEALETQIDDFKARFEAPSHFAVPGQDPLSAALDVARTVVRRAERASVAAAADGSHVLVYLNRLSDLVWTLARWVEGTTILAKDA